ncbi:MAG: PecA family PE domain-processing aspartic protease [Mycobacterium sp.]
MTLGLAPLATAPRAHADIDDLITQPIVDAIDQATSLVDPSLLGAADPGLDVDSLLAPTLAASSVDTFASLDSLLSNWFQTFVYDPVHELEQAWITSVAAAFTSPDNGAWGWLVSDSAAGMGGGATVGSASADVGVASAAASTDALTTASVPLQMSATTEPLVDISVGGGPSVPVLVDTGSQGLVIPWWDIGFQNLGWPTGLGIGGYTGADSSEYYVYLTLPTTVSFGNGIVTTPTPVDVAFFTFPATFQSIFGGADGVLGIGPNAGGPGPSSVLTALPGDLSQGVLIDQANGVLQFGPNPLTDGISVAGAPGALLLVSINGGPPHAVSAIIDSGGVYGTMPSSIIGNDQVSGAVAPGTQISVYTADGQPLYSYMTTTTNAPTVSSASTMNTGNVPFALQPVYISNSPSGHGATIFDDCVGVAGFCTAV